MKSSKEFEANRRLRLKYTLFLHQCIEMSETEHEKFQRTWVKGSSFEEDYMTVYDLAVQEGRLKTIVELFEDGTLNSKKALAILRNFVAAKKMSRAFANKAIQQIGAK